MERNRLFKTEITEHVSDYNAVTGHFEAIKYEATPLLDTSVKVQVELCITWDQKENFMRELVQLIKKYQI